MACSFTLSGVLASRVKVVVFPVALLFMEVNPTQFCSKKDAQGRPSFCRDHCLLTDHAFHK
jgi:hypothetical protein